MKKSLLFILGIFFIPFSICYSQYSLQNVFSTTTFNKPLEMVVPTDGTDRLFIVGQRGIITVVYPSQPSTPGKVFLDISDKVIQSGLEPGLLGLAFHPNFSSNRYFYVYYDTPAGTQEVIARYQVSPTNPDSALKSSELIILQNTMSSASHYGGKIAFGKDNYLYIGWGMGTGQNDPPNNAQNLTLLLGKILRINIDTVAGGNNYGIPSTNPFKDSVGSQRKEIYAWGFRNPWKFSFDSTGRMWCGDVGQNTFEEIDIVNRGKNYGWRIMEGNNCFNPNPCDTTGLVKPIYQYPRTDGTSISGGYVSYTNQLPSVKGKYIYGDYTNGKIWALTYDGINPTTTTLLLDSPYNISSFGMDKNKNIYICSIGDNKIYKLVDNTVGTEPYETNFPSEFSLKQNYPNPFNPVTYIQFNLKEKSEIKLEVFNLEGKRVGIILNENKDAGEYGVRFDAVNYPSGIYYYKLTAAGASGSNFVSTKKMVLLK
ncbi:MAG: PQQ-dependent sugar dehydrogenase [Ignavibacteria bacterium]|nr:PQQ-dependent sugar dehydrogenase [Ignavibacteria bacterium]